MVRRLTREELEWFLEREEIIRELFGQKGLAKGKFILIREMLIEPKHAYERTVEKMKSNRWVIQQFLDRLEKLGYVKVEEKQIVIRKNKEITFLGDEY